MSTASSEAQITEMIIDHNRQAKAAKVMTWIRDRVAAQQLHDADLVDLLDTISDDPEGDTAATLAAAADVNRMSVDTIAMVAAALDTYIGDRRTAAADPFDGI
jgi:hypothetical protein